MDRNKQAARVSWVTLAGNLILTGLKLVIGLATGSLVVLSDAVHSASDSLSTILVIFGLYIAQQPPDEKHPYGHSRAETIVAKIIALTLIFIGLNFAYSAVRVIWLGDHTIPGVSALWISIISIMSKEIMYRYTVKTADKLDSPALKADAWHHRSDALSSVAAVLGVFAARLGYPIFDPLMAIVVAAIIVKVGWNMVFVVIDELMDAQVDTETVGEIEKIILGVSEVCTLADLKVHKYGAEHHVHFTITVPPELTVVECHALSHKIKERIRQEFASVSHVDMHIEPDHFPESD